MSMRWPMIIPAATYEMMRRKGYDMRGYEIETDIPRESHNATPQQHETATSAEKHNETDS